jgi:hypothetical protein
MSEEEVREILKGEFTLDIPNFEKWNPPIINKKTGQPYEIQMRDNIRFSIHFLDDPKMHGLTDSEILFWQRVVIQRGKSAAPLRHCSGRYLALIGRREGRRVATALYKLLKRGLIVLSKEINKEIKEEEERGNHQPPPETPTNQEEKNSLNTTDELRTPRILEIQKRRAVTDRGLDYWSQKITEYGLSQTWLRDQIEMLDLEVDQSPPTNGFQKPFIQRLNEYLTKRAEWAIKNRDEYQREETEAERKRQHDKAIGEWLQSQVAYE